MSELVAIRPPSRGIRNDGKPHLRGMLPDELAQWSQDAIGGPKFRAKQIFEWLHQKRAVAFEDMTNLPKTSRAELDEHATIAPLRIDATLRAADGTRKLRLRTHDDELIECVLIPNDGRGLTLCISSMIGCSLTCQFCATQTMGFTRNLAAWEIVDQVYRAQDVLAEEAAETGTDFVPRITNLVLMGMGEPLHNFNQVRQAIRILTDPAGAAIAGRRITVSTAGLVPGIERFAAEGLAEEVGLAVSLNATTDEVRSQIMPINTRWSIAELLAAVRGLPQPKRRRVTFEYVLLRGVNDTPTDARRLGTLLRGMDGHVNAIPFNPHPAAAYERPTEDAVELFVETARSVGLKIHVRTPRGDDIGAACGQLALSGKASTQVPA